MYMHYALMEKTRLPFIGSDFQGLWEGGSAGTLTRGPDRQEGARESPKRPIALATEVIF
jgi:hypothetical protein